MSADYLKAYPKLKYEFIEGCFLGLAAGDALGVPVEFKSRAELTANPVKTMTGHGTWNQVLGTWSDDSSLAFCLAESLSRGSFNLKEIADLFLKWKEEGYWGAHHRVFDIGNTTFASLRQYSISADPFTSGMTAEESNGNGSLMRIAPAGIWFTKHTDEHLYDAVSAISGITHAHPISKLSCFIFCHLLSGITKGLEKKEAFEKTIEVTKFLPAYRDLHDTHKRYINRVISSRVIHKTIHEIKSDGYVLNTLEASIWTWLTTDGFKDAVLTAVNLGEDTDTTACVTGALAGLYYGSESIPKEWISSLARRADIITLCQRFSGKVLANVFSLVD